MLKSMPLRLYFPGLKGILSVAVPSLMAESTDALAVAETGFAAGVAASAALVCVGEVGVQFAASLELTGVFDGTSGFFEGIGGRMPRSFESGFGTEVTRGTLTH